ncbi:MAG: hypothetical protein WDZ91_05245 [Paenibacillaceae bacterium]
MKKINFLDEWKNEMNNIEVPHQKIRQQLQNAIKRGRKNRDRHRKWRKIINSMAVSVIVLIVMISTAFVSPAVANVLEHIPGINIVVEKMTTTIFNYKTLKATFIENAGGKVTTIHLSLDYNEQQAISIMSDSQGNIYKQYLIENNQSLQYNKVENTYYQAPILNEISKKPSKVSHEVNGGHINLSNNSLPMPLGRVSIAIQPEQYALDLMQKAKVSIKGETSYVGRITDIVEVRIPNDMVDSIGSDKIEFYVDRETGIILKMTQMLKDKVIYDLYATEFKINEKFESSIFQINVPYNAVRIEDF